jgi:hypothetical protein
MLALKEHIRYIFEKENAPIFFQVNHICGDNFFLTQYDTYFIKWVLRRFKLSFSFCQQLRKTRALSLFPVGLASSLGVSSPIVR